jgi:polysaccharide chain length determinant protein (PEP-CTERM system associated)
VRKYKNNHENPVNPVSLIKGIKTMQGKDEAFKFDHYLNLVLKRRWFIIIPFCLATIIGIYLAIALPRVYQASSLILIKPQQVPQDYVQSAIVAANIESKIMTISKKILSRANIHKIIDQFNLYVNPEQADMIIEEKIADLRNRVLIELQIPDDRREADSFTISFQWPDPQVVAMVANNLAASFINEDLKGREAEAVDTTQFLDDQLSAMRERLKEFETRLGDYRKRYMGELPEQLDSNLRILDTLQQQLSEYEERLRDEKNRLALLEIEIKAQKESLAGGAMVSEEGEALSLPQLKNQLYTLQSSYTDQHPDVIRLKAQIADMEAKIKSGQLNSSGGANLNTSLNEEQLISSSDVLGEQIRQRREIKTEIASLGEDIRKLKNEIRIYQQRIERTPKREEELMALNRDYKNIQESYNSLLNRKLEAEVAVNMEKKQKGEQFSILESAKVPTTPVSPNIKILFLLAVAVASGIGFGLIFLIDYFDTSLKDPNDFESDLGVSLLATIPKVYRKKDIRLKRLNLLMTGISIAATILLFVGFAMLAAFGVESTIEMIQNLPELWATNNSLSR